MVENDPVLKFVCPVCEAARGELCHAQIGIVRFECHLERKNLADEEMLDNIAEGNAIAFMSEQRSSGKWQSS
jgi:hypothetical protein